MALIGMTGGETWPPVKPPQKGPAVHTYEVEINGMTTTLKLSDEDAEARGLKPAASKAKTPANKQATPANKSAAPAKRAAKGNAGSGH